MIKKTTLSIIFLFIFLGVLFLENCKPKVNSSELALQQANAYVGDAQCKSCHTTEYADWLKSDHYKSIQEPTDSSVIGNFNNSIYDADGVKSHFFKKNKKFVINTEGNDGKVHDYEIKYTFGHYPLQQYLIQFPDGKLQATRLSWDSKQNKWFNQYAGQKIDYRDWLHWTGNAQNWNTMCAECHSTNLKKNYNIEKDAYNTKFDLLNVSCEACHGPGKNHIDYINGSDYSAGKKVEHSFLQLGANTAQLSQVNTCMPCHSVQSKIEEENSGSEELLDHHIPVLPDTNRFYADGQVKDEDYTYASFLQSKMFARGIKCNNCHNPHSGKLLLTGNQTCLQCHAKTFDSPAHHFHQTNTAGAECKNCHAPGKYFMGNDLRHDHSFRIPRPDLSVQYATPNACNNCHTNKTAQWSVAAIIEWYGPRRKYQFAEDLIPGTKAVTGREAHLFKLIRDTSVPIIIKATAIHDLENSTSVNSFNILISSLSNKDASIRYHALKSLMHNYEAINDKVIIANLLTDKVKAVRIASAELFDLMGPTQLPQSYLPAFANAKNELERYLLYQADFAHGNISIADYYARNKNFVLAEKFYKRAIQKDSLANLARLNLSVTYNLQSKNIDAVNILKVAIKTDEKNDQAWYQLALLYNEMGNTKACGDAFEKVVSLKSINARAYYNYGLFLQQHQNNNKAISILLKGLSLDPLDERLNYAIAFVYIESGKKDKALPYVLMLKKLNPSNTSYKELFNLFQLD